MYILSDGHDSYEPPYLITNTCMCTFRRSLRGWNGQWCMYDEKKSVLIVPGVSILYHELLLEYVAHGCPRREGKRGCVWHQIASLQCLSVLPFFWHETRLTLGSESVLFLCGFSSTFSPSFPLSLSRQLQSFRRTLTISKLRLTSLTANDATHHKRDPFVCLNL